MFKAKLEVNGHERWLTALHYEYFCPVDINEDRYRKFLQKNFPYELSDSYNLAPYNHRSLPLIKQSLLDKELERKCRQNLDDATSSYKMESVFKAMAAFGEKDDRKNAYYYSLAKARHNAGLDRRLAPNFSLNYDKFIRPIEDLSARVTYNKFGGLFSLAFDSTEADEPFYEWMLNGDMKQGRIVFYDGDLDQAFKIEFWDCYCVGLAEHMSSQGSAPMRIHLRLSPAITRNRSVEDQKVWKVTDISPKSKAFGPGATTEELAYDELYMVDDKNNIIDDVVPGMHVDLVIKTSGCIGKSITIDLSNEKCDYKHNGEIVKDDILKNYVINQNTERVPLEVIKQQPLNNN